MYNLKEGVMKEKTDTVATTFSMSVVLKERAQIYIATYNRMVKEKNEGKRLNLSILVNKVLSEYLDKVNK